MLFGGDFRQIPPVLRRVPQECISSYCLRSCSFWKNPQHIVKYELTRNKRAENDESYAQFVLDVGNGVFCSPPDFICTSGRDDFSPASVILSDDIRLHDGDTLDSLISLVFEDSLGQGFPDENAALTFFEGRCIVTPTNESAVSINNLILSGIDGDTTIVYSSDSILNSGETSEENYPVEFFHTIETQSLPPHAKVVKEVAVFSVGFWGLNRWA